MLLVGPRIADDAVRSVQIVIIGRISGSQCRSDALKTGIRDRAGWETAEFTQIISRIDIEVGSGERPCRFFQNIPHGGIDAEPDLVVETFPENAGDHGTLLTGPRFLLDERSHRDDLMQRSFRLADVFGEILN